jgi:flagellar biosynthesis protein FlhF
MPLELLTNPSIPRLLEQAHASFGPEAVVLHVRKISTPAGPQFEMLAGDSSSGLQMEGDDRSAPAATSMRILRGLKQAKGAESGRPSQMIALVGPTGAGKTTAIAKLAGHPDAFGGQAVGLLCLDTFRIGAVEQSRLYAKLAGIPVEVAYERNEIPRVLRRLKDCRVVLVDTAGRGPLAKSDRDSTLGLLGRLRLAQVHLVLPAGIRPSLARRLVQEYQRFGLTHILPTKIDEYADIDWLFRLAAENMLPIRWVSNGQAVPDDLYAASIDESWSTESSHPYLGAEAMRIMQ